MTAQLPRRLASAFVLYGLLAIAFLALNMPPFQNTDETSHFMRAAQVADGGLIGTRFSTTDADGVQHLWAGGAVDPVLLQAFAPAVALIGHPDARATRANWLPALHWTGTRAMLGFANTAVYPPLFYLPAAIGVRVGQAAALTVVQTLVLSRLLTGVTAVAVAAAAIACAGGAAVWLFAILTLPMSLSLIASTSQDALLLACSALAGALLVRALRWPGERDGRALAVTLLLVATARPPYVALALLPLALTMLRLKWRVLAAAAIVAGVIAWSGIAAARASTNYGALFFGDPMAQLARLRDQPLLLVRASWAALAQHWPGYLEQFVGLLGWQDTRLPPAYHTAALIMLAVAALAATLGLRGQRIGIGSRLLIVTGLLLSAAGVFAIEYLTATIPGGAVVNGVSGRYFLPLALAGTGLLPALGNPRWARLHDALVLAVAAFPVVSLAVLMRAVVLRYYLG